MKRVIKDYFTFSRKETVAAVILLLLTGGFIVLPYFYPSKKSVPVVNKKLQEQLAKLANDSNQQNVTGDNEEDWKNPFQASSNMVEPGFTLFEFDPNTIGAEQWKRLGIRDKTIKTILNYRNKGGRFRKPEDIRKIWGLRKEEAGRIIPYAKIAKPSNQNFIPASNNKAFTNNKPVQPVDINMATAQQLMELPGMDHLIPYRVIKFRDKLGGFLRVEQVKETYGMSDSVYQSILPYLKIESTTIKKINLNSTNGYELNMHPYINRDISQAIIIYRTQHGVYQKVEDIRKIVFITEKMYQKIAPYLTVE